MVNEELYLPWEIIAHIVSFLPSSCHKRNCMLVSQNWYLASICQLYRSPSLNDENIDQFFDTIYPREDELEERAIHLATMIRNLHLGELTRLHTQNSKEICLNLLLQRVQNKLEKFEAPPWLPLEEGLYRSLSLCKRLKYLDLYGSTFPVTYYLLFQTIGSLTRLETLVLPLKFENSQAYRISDDNNNNNNNNLVSTNSNIWPSNLQKLFIGSNFHLNAVDQFFIFYVSEAPKSLSNIVINFFCNVHAEAIIFTLNKIGSQLTHLSIDCTIHISELSRGQLDSTLRLCPSLEFLLIREDYVTENLFKNLPRNHKLQCIELEGTIYHKTVHITPDILLGTLRNGQLSNLRNVYHSKYLSWDDTKESRFYVQALLDAMYAMEAKNPLYKSCGVESFASKWY